MASLLLIFSSINCLLSNALMKCNDRIEECFMLSLYTQDKAVMTPTLCCVEVKVKVQVRGRGLLYLLYSSISSVFFLYIPGKSVVILLSHFSGGTSVPSSCGPSVFTSYGVSYLGISLDMG